MKKLFLTFFVILTSCSEDDRNLVLPHYFYVWNHVWTDSVSNAYIEWQQDVGGFHVLVSTVNQLGKVKRVQLNEHLIDRKKSLTYVIRIDGDLLPDPHFIGDEIKFLEINQLINDNDRVEIDFDAPTSQLAAYKKWLDVLRNDIEYPLGITAIPTWLESNALESLLNSLDYYVLQVHSVLSPKKGLFDPTLAITWAKAFDGISNTPFLLSLPNYWYRAEMSGTGEIMFLSAEQIHMQPTNNSQEIFANPNDINIAMQSLEQSALSNLEGYIWFRLPNARDERIFADTTIRHLMGRRENWQNKHLELIIKPVKPGSKNHDFWLVNPSEVDVIATGIWPMVIGCEPKHLIDGAGYELNHLTFTVQQVFKPAEQLRVGWGVCHQEKPS